MSLNQRLIRTNDTGGAGGLFLAAGSGTYSAAYSADGINWTGVTDSGIAALDSCNAVGSANGNFYLAGGIAGTPTVRTLWHSTDGINWTERTNPQINGAGTVGKYIGGFMFDGVRLYCIGIRTYYTTDLTASGGWTEVTNSVFGEYGLNMSYTGQNWVVTGRNTPVIKYSTNGTSFTDVTTPRIAYNAINVSSNGTGAVVASGYDVSRVASSTDHGVTWTSRITAGSVGYLSYWDGTKFHVDVNGGSYYQSPNGISFTSYTKPLSTRIEQMASNGSVLVAAGAGTSTLAYSTDGGANWNSLGTSMFTTGRDITCDGDPNLIRI